MNLRLIQYTTNGLFVLFYANKKDMVLLVIYKKEFAQLMYDYCFLTFLHILL